MIDNDYDKLDPNELFSNIVSNDIDDDEDLSSSDEEFEIKSEGPKLPYDENEKERALAEIMKAYYEKREQGGINQ